jgi:hypothetical protein
VVTYEDLRRGSVFRPPHHFVKLEGIGVDSHLGIHDAEASEHCFRTNAVGARLLHVHGHVFHEELQGYNATRIVPESVRDRQAVETLLLVENPNGVIKVCSKTYPKDIGYEEPTCNLPYSMKEDDGCSNGKKHKHNDCERSTGIFKTKKYD